MCSTTNNEDVPMESYDMGECSYTQDKSVFDLPRPATAFRYKYDSDDSWDSPKKVPQNSHIVWRENLHAELVPALKQQTKTQFEWTDSFWKKPRANVDEDQEMPSMESLMEVYSKESREQKLLNRALSQPVKLGKAERMMQKMGWHGGALGKSGKGIVVPIIPNVAYGTKVGLGSYTEGLQGPSQPFANVEKSQAEMFEVFDINTLLYIDEFVRNNTEEELLFENTLTDAEKHRVEQLVASLQNVETLGTLEYSSNYAMELAKNIITHNCYLLRTTQKRKDHPDGMLCLSKLAPNNMCLILPGDLRYETENKTLEHDEDENAFMQSITRALENCHTDDALLCEENCKHDSKIVSKICDSFVEFGAIHDVTSFRHIGAFREEEKEALNFFYAMAQKYLNGETTCFKLRSIMEKVNFEIGVDCNQQTAIFKKYGPAPFQRSCASTSWK